MAKTTVVTIGGHAHVIDEKLNGIYDGVNTIFTTNQKFNPSFIQVFFNGQALHQGVLFDYTVAEGGGPGSGYNTVNVMSAPRSLDILTVNYNRLS